MYILYRKLACTSKARTREYIIIKDETNAPDWYCAQVLQVLTDRVKVAWLTTKVEPLENYSKASNKARKSCLKGAVFART